MAAAHPSTISMAGAGFGNEDAVGAHALLCLLAERPYLEPSLGSPTAVQFQTRNLGWTLDDLLVESRSPLGVHRAAISVKLNEPVKTTGFPRDFVRRCWQLALEPGLSGFDPALDRLVLASNRPSTKVQAALDHLLKFAAANPEGYAGDLGSALGRTLFDSFSCPGELASTSASQPKPVTLLAAVQVLNFDFLDPNSSSLKDCLALCRTLVETGSAEDADRLWTDLLEHVKGLRPAGGRVTSELLLRHLRIRCHRLTVAPDYRHAWDHLATLSELNLSDVRDVLGDQVHLERPEFQEELLRSVALNRITVLLGRSGSGKSSALKALAAHGPADRPRFLLTPEDVERLENRHLEAGVRHPLSALPSTQPAPEAVLFLDGLDRMFETSAALAVSRLIRALRLDAGDTNWRLVVTSQPQEWERLAATIPEIPPCAPIDVPPLGAPERAALLAQAPDLAPLLTGIAGPVLYTLKVIDLVARSRTTPSAAWVGDADALTAWWDAVVACHPQAHSLERTVTRIGHMQAKGRNRYVALHALDSGDTDVLRTLERLCILTTRDGLVSFEHALIGDYARARYLMSLLCTDERALHEHLYQPEWRSAFQLTVAIHLEAAARTGAREDLTRLLARIPAEAGIDLLCEAAVAPPYSDRLLPVLDPLVSAEGFLPRLLLRIWATVTSPVKLRPEIDKTFTVRDRVFWDREARLPIRPLWTPVITWLLHHQAAIRAWAPLGFVPIASASLDWPQRLGREVPLQSEVASVTLDIASDFHEDCFRRDIEEADLERLFLTALLGARYHPERFEALARDLAGLVPPAKPEDAVEQPARLFIDDERVTVPWPDGPLTKPHRAFRKVALSSRGAQELASFDASLASTIFLALLIAPPGQSRSATWRDDLQIEGGDEAPPCHDFAPLQALLDANTNAALKFLNRLVDFATERYVEARRRPRFGEAQPASPVPTPGVSLRVGGSERFFAGDVAVFGWHGGVGMQGVIGSALMTLEHYFYSIADAERDRWIEDLLTRSSSVAILGVLSELAIRNPALLEGPLRPLLDDPALLKVAQLAAFEIARTPVPGSWPGESSDRARLRYEWRQLPQHQTDLFSASCDWLRAGHFTWGGLAEVRARWVRCRDREAGAKAFSAWCDDLLYLTDANNWHPVHGPDGEEILVLADSERFQADRQELARQEASILPWSVAVRCQRLLESAEPLSAEQIGSLAALLDAPTHPPEPEVLLGPVPLPGIVASTLLAKAGNALTLADALRDRCDALVLAMTLNPPAPGPLDHRRSPCLACWDFFAACAIPGMLARYGLTPSIRRALSMLALAPHDHAVASFLSQVVGYGMVPKQEAESLLHLVVLAARLDLLASWATSRLPVLAQACREEIAAVQKCYQRGALSPLPPNWSTINAFVPRGRRLRTMLLLLRSRGLLASVPQWTNYDLLRAAFAWIVDGLDRLPAGERRRRATYVLELRHALSSPVSRDDGPDRAGHFDTHLLIGRSVAALLLSEPDQEARRNLSAAFFETKDSKERRYPTEEIIIETLFRRGLLSGGENPLFRRVHSELFQRCFGQDGVLLSDAGWAGVRELAKRFLGAGVSRLSAIWSEEHVELFEVFEGTWRRWVKVSFSHWGCGTAFLRLLRTPAAKTARLALLCLIGPEELEDPSDEKDFDAALLDLIQLCWEEHQVELQSDAASREAFQRALRRLIRQGMPDAVLLEQAVASRWTTR
jgi:energy-coupling factor transporter ATP-binding protein EcfA2